jgi:plasmid segregation protein ParM
MTQNTSPKHMVLPAGGLDIGFHTTKFTTGTSSTPGGTVINTDSFPSLAPQLTGANAAKYQGVGIDGVFIELEGKSFLVGRAAEAAIDGSGQVRAANTNYSETSTYKALFLGALAQMAKHQGATGSLTIQWLTMGLPVSTVMTHRKQVEAMAKGTHEVPYPGKPGHLIKVHIKNALVICQPQGALIYHCQKLNSQMSNETVLILDMGGGTFDWFISTKMVPNFGLSNSINKGTLESSAAVLEKLVTQESLDPVYKDNPSLLERVDQSMRNGSPTIGIMGRKLALEPHLPLADSVVKSALADMSTRLGTAMGSIEQVLLTGGGAPLVKRNIATALPAVAQMVQMDDEPVMSNVKGFYYCSLFKDEEGA